MIFVYQAHRLMVSPRLRDGETHHNYGRKEFISIFCATCDTPKQEHIEFDVSWLIYQARAGAVLKTATRHQRSKDISGTQTSGCHQRRTSKHTHTHTNARRGKTSEDRKRHSIVAFFILHHSLMARSGRSRVTFQAHFRALSDLSGSAHKKRQTAQSVSK